MPTLSELKEQQQQALFQQINLMSQAANAISGSAQEAADIVNEVVEENISFIKEQNQIAQSFFAPYSAAGQKGLGKLEDILGLNGQDALASASNEVLQGADVQAAVNLGVDSYLRSAAAGSQGIRSGRVAQEIQQFGQQTAFGALDRRRSDLFQLVDRGLNASANQASLAQSLGQEVSAQKTTGAEASANAKIIAGSATANSLLAQSPLIAALNAPYGFLSGGGAAGSIAGGGSQYGSGSSISGNQGFFFGGDAGPRVQMGTGLPLDVKGSKYVPAGSASGGVY